MKEKKYLFYRKILTIVLFINTLLLIIIKLSNLIKVNNENYEVNSYLNNYNEEVGYINKEEYLGILEIKKIKLRKGFYKLNSNLNNVDKNIMIVSSSDMPDVNKGNLILASHSGNSSVSYFRYLDKLDMEDIASIYYLGKKYDYKLINYYDVDKNGSVQIIKNNDINTLTLITCKKNTDKQIEYIISQTTDINLDNYYLLKEKDGFYLYKSNKS